MLLKPYHPCLNCCSVTCAWMLRVLAAAFGYPPVGKCSAPWGVALPSYFRLLHCYYEDCFGSCCCLVPVFSVDMFQDKVGGEGLKLCASGSGMGRGKFLPSAARWVYFRGGLVTSCLKALQTSQTSLEVQTSERVPSSPVPYRADWNCTCLILSQFVV